MNSSEQLKFHFSQSYQYKTEVSVSRPTHLHVLSISKPKGILYTKAFTQVTSLSSLSLYPHLRSSTILTDWYLTFGPFLSFFNTLLPLLVTFHHLNLLLATISHVTNFNHYCSRTYTNAFIYRFRLPPLLVTFIVTIYLLSGHIILLNSTITLVTLNAVHHHLCHSLPFFLPP